jgi:hypothetical protein
MVEAPPRYLLPDWQRIYRPAPALPPLHDGDAVLVVRPDDPIFAETLGRESLAPLNRNDVAYTRHVTRLREAVDIDGAMFVLLGEWDATKEDDPFDDAWAFYRAPKNAVEALLTSSGLSLIPMSAALTPAPAPIEALGSLLPIETRFTRAPPPVVAVELDQVLRLVATGALTTEDAVLELALDDAQRRAVVEAITADVPERYRRGVDLRSNLPVPGTKAFEAYLVEYGERIFVHGTCFAELDAEARAATVRGWIEHFHVPQARPSLPPQLRPQKAAKSTGTKQKQKKKKQKQKQKKSDAAE